jgi:hypothetical protein
MKIINLTDSDILDSDGNILFYAAQHATKIQKELEDSSSVMADGKIFEVKKVKTIVNPPLPEYSTDKTYIVSEGVASFFNQRPDLVFVNNSNDGNLVLRHYSDNWNQHLVN